jgi:recombination associated protein RdgC
MFFKNVIAYRLTQTIAFDVAELEELLAGKAHREPASQELSTYGFVSPFKNALVETALAPSGEYLLIAAKKTERILPGNVIRDELKKKVDAIEFEQQRKIYKKERDQIKDEIIQEFLPRAFLRSKVTHALIMPAAGLVLVDASSPKVAEDILSTLREVLGSLPVRPLSVKIAPVATMTDWVKVQKAADDFFVLDECEMRDTHEDGGTVKCKGQDLTSNEIEGHIATGKLVTKLSLAWKDKFSFMLDDKLVIKRLRFEDLLQDQAEADGGDDAHGQLVASLIIMAGAFVEFFPALLDALGGEELPQGIDVGSADFDELADQEKLDLTEAIKFVRESGKASISAIQRKFTWGYNRAARMIEALENAGVVTQMNTNGSREVIQ